MERAGAGCLPTLSAVVPTNRPLPRVRPTVEALLRDSAVIEVLVAVDGPQSATLGPELDAWDAASPRLRVLRLPQRVGGETARRIGAEAALGEVVWFVDDDIVPEEGCGAGHAQAHAETNAQVVIGPFETPDGAEAGVPSRLYSESFRHEWTRFVSAPETILLGFWAGNHSVRRSALLSLETVPEVFRHSYHADRAFGLICARAGLVAVARPELRATHRYGPALDVWREHCRKQGAGRIAIHSLYEDIVGPDIAAPWSVGLGPRARLGLRLAESNPRVAGLVADGLAFGVRLLTRLRRHGIALRLGRTLRSVEQHRGAEAARRVAAFVAAPAADAGTPHAATVPTAVTVLVVSRGPGSRLRRVLETWRPHVAEIVVVADLSGEPGLLDAVSDLADRTATVECAFPVESVLERCRALCRQPFVFRADDDEVPTTVLLAELRSLTLDPTLQQAGIPMRWLWPDETTWIDEYPWACNPQPKLVRNHAGLVRFQGRVHTTEHLEAPMRAVPLPVYHLRTLDPIADRRARIAGYAGVGGGACHFDGRPANSQYLPEEAGALRIAGVPAWDRASLGRVLAGTAAEADAAIRTARPLPIALGSRPRLPDGSHRASVRVKSMQPPVAVGAALVLEVVIANRSDTVLPGGDCDDAAVALSTCWRPADADGAGQGPDVLHDGPRHPLGEPIPPGRAVTLVVPVSPPVGPGRWHVTVDLVEESVAWFGDGDEILVTLAGAARMVPARPAAGDGLFQTILIETRNVCTRVCWFCKFGQERHDAEIRQMDWDTIHQILANLKDLDYRGRISWYNINEPLSDRRIFDILSRTREHCPGAFLSLTTNGDLLDAQAYNRLKRSGLDALGVSMYDDLTLERIRPFADASLVFLDMRDAKPGVLENRGGNIRHDAEAFRPDWVAHSGHGCERPSTMLVVNPAGEVVLCCADMYSDVVMGQVGQDRLEDIWRNERFTHYRQTLAAEGRRNLPLCSACSYSGMGVRPFFPYSPG